MGLHLSWRTPCWFAMAIAGPGGVDAAIASGLDLDGTPIPAAMVELYQEVMELESQRARSGGEKVNAQPSCQDWLKTPRSGEPRRPSAGSRLGWSEAEGNRLLLLLSATSPERNRS